MSILTDLLSRIKPAPRSGDVPPGLKRIVSDFTESELIKKKAVLFSGLILLSIAVGIGGMYVMERYRTSSISIHPSPSTLVKESESLLPPPTLTGESPDRPSPLMGEGQGGGDKVREEPLTPIQAPEALKEDVKMPPVISAPNRPSPLTGESPDRPSPLMGEGQGGGDKERKVVEQQVAEEIREKTRPLPGPDPGDGDEKGTKKGAASGEKTQNKDLNLYIAKTYEDKKDYARAVESYKKALELDLRNYVIMNNISSMLLQLGQFEESIRYSKWALSIKEDYVPSLVNLGIAYIKLKSFAEGEGYLLKAITLEPSNRHAVFNIALLYERMDEYDKAAISFERLSQLGDVQGYLGLARIAEREGRISDAIRFYREIITMADVEPQIKRFVNERLVMLEQ